MFIRVHLPTMIDGHFQSNPILAVSDTTAHRLIKAGMASPDPYLDAMKDKARQLGQFVDWPTPERQQSRATSVIAAVGNESESFGERLKRAVKARQTAMRATTRKQAEQDAQRESARYRKVQSRPRTQSD
jgi:hypothetical protein